MTIQNQNKRVAYSGDGATTVFAFPFRVQSEDDVLVVLQNASGTDTVQAIATNYSVSGVGVSSGGSIEMVTAPASGETLSVIIDPDLTQLTDYSSGGQFPAESHEDALDKIVNLAKRTRDLVERSISLPDGDIDGSGTYDAKGNKVSNLAVGSESTDAASVETVNALIAAAMIDATQAISTFAGTLLDDADSDAFLTTLEYDNGETGAVAYPVRSRLQGVLMVTDFGAVGDGATNDDTAFTAAATAAAAGGFEVFIPHTGSHYVVTSNPELNRFYGPGDVRVSSNRVYVKPTPGPAVEIFAEVFGLPSDSTTDAAPALQRAITYAQDQDLPLTMPPRQVYQTESTLVVEQGNDTTEFTSRREFTWNGNSCELRPNFDGATIDVQPQATLAYAASNPGAQLGQIIIRDLHLNGETAISGGFTNCTALKLGRQGYAWSSNVRSVIDGVKVLNFGPGTLTDYAVRITNARNIEINNLAVLSEGGTIIENPDNHSLGFAGDLWFNNCDFFGNNSTKRPLYIAGNNTTSANSAHCEAITFSKCFFYDGGSRIYAGNSDGHRHIVFDHCYFDTPDAGDRFMELLADGTGFLDRIIFTGCDFVAAQAAALAAIVTGGSADIRQLSILGGFVLSNTDGGGDTDAILFNGVTHAIVRDVAFKSVANTNACIRIQASDHVSVMGCTADVSLAANTDFVQVDDDGDCDDWHIVGNAASVTGTGAVANVISNGASGSGLVANNQTTST